MLEKQLEILEDNTFTHGLSRSQHLEAILNSLDKGDSLGITIIERILAICIRDLKEDVRHAAFCLNIISKILNGYQANLPVTKLLPSAEAILTLILTAASLHRAESLQTIGFNTLLDYPEDVLAELAVCYSDIYEVFNLYCHLKMPVEIRFQPIYLAHKIMKKLTLDKKTTFVKNGKAVWFSKVVPCAMNCFQTQIIGPTPIALKLLELLEMLTEELTSIDYVGNAQWETVLENIYNPNAYPAQVKYLLTNGSVLWHRIWIIFIKLLKTQITMNKPGVGSPINSMLPVVEMAFKLDVENRCRAFQCWNILIDNFSAETNELFVTKRIKLLIIPLRSNNAKVKETALAKFETWWHLIKQYETRVDDRILYPFLHFCFGRHVPEKTAVIPGLLSPIIKKKCVEAFVELVGHVNCEGCGLEAKLKKKLISTKELVDHWSNWLYSLKMAIKISAEDDVGIGKQPITCAWKSVLMTIAEMPENNIRRDLFNDLLTIVKEMAQESTSNGKMADIVNNVLISSLLEEDTFKQLLKSVECLSGPLHALITLLVNSTYTETCKKHNVENILTNLKLITEFIVLECPILEEKLVEWLVIDAPANDNTLQLWIALAEALQVSKSRYDCLQRMCNVLLWPLKNLDHFTSVESAALTWHNTYRVLHLIQTQTSWFHVELNRILTSSENSSSSATFFFLCVLLAVIKTKISTPTFKGINRDLKQLQEVTCIYNDYNEVKAVFPILIDTLDLLAATAANDDVFCAHIPDIFLIAKKVLNILINQLKNNDTAEGVIIGKIVDAIELLYKNERSKPFKGLLVDELHKCRSLINITTTHVPSNLDSLLKSIMLDKDIDQSLKEEIVASYEKSVTECKNDVSSAESNESKIKEQDQSKFTTPVTKSANKNSKKKEANIVSTVVDNGEEYAVIKSNWKFNPRKLTENQKEKLQRKREDIPALYQDLSQSQDEFKLKSWKTDSQDASTTDSKSASTPSNDNISTVKNMSGTEIVPKIIDNFFSGNNKGDVAEKKDINEELKPTTVDQAKASPKVKTPRMALKDRVFRNVRNLIEKSTGPKEGPQKPDVLNRSIHTNNLYTPVTKCKETKNVNSAPSKISADRPARVKRIPKKFDDTEIYLQKKTRNSSSQNDSQAMDTTDASQELREQRRNSTGQNDSQTTYTTDASEKLQKKRRISPSQNYSQKIDTTDASQELQEQRRNSTGPNDYQTSYTTDASEKVQNKRRISSCQSYSQTIDTTDASQELQEKRRNCTGQNDSQTSYSTDASQKVQNKRRISTSQNYSQTIFITDASQEVQKKRRKSTSQNDSQTMDTTDAFQEVTILPENNDQDVKKLVKVANIVVENLVVVNNAAGKPIDSITKPSLDNHGKTVDSVETKLMVAEVSSSSVQEVDSKKNKDNCTNINLVGNVGCSQSDVSADKSIEDTQLPEQDKDDSGKNFTLHSNITKRKKKKSAEEKYPPEQVKETLDQKSLLPNHDNKTKNTKSVKDKQQSEQVKKIASENSSTPITGKRKELNEVKSTTKKKSRIEKQLAIDMVEGHPFLKLQSEKRVAKKCLTNTPNSTRRKSLADKLNKSKTDPKNTSKPKKETSNANKDLPKEKSQNNTKDMSVTVYETQDISLDATQDLSEDVIESSQDTTTTISVKSFRSCKPSSSTEDIGKTVEEAQKIIDISTQEINSTCDIMITEENKDDTELPANKTDIQVNATMELTEEMDTEPTSSGDVILVNDDDNEVIDLNTDCDPGPGPDTLELASADTEPTNHSQFVNDTNVIKEPSQDVVPNSKTHDDQNHSKTDDSQLPSTADDRTITLVDISQDEGTGASSPTSGDDQRKKDFLNNTSEISPIKSLSPIEPKSPSPETSCDYMVIKLSGPLQPNGEPLDMSNSPEIFTEDKTSPEKRDQSPPRQEVTVTNNSPSSSLSLKKNRPQVRSGGRAAQMLGLCVPDRLQNIKHVDRPEAEEPKKSSPVNTPARRNLRMLYQTAMDGDSSDKEESEKFLKFKKTLPAADCSPSGPILKRKLAEITDEATVSPANKRKRVSFHDPVSTSVSVQKYIETCGVRSPQNSALKRLERQLRHQNPMKSPKRLECLFKLDSMLTKAVESFNESDFTSSNDTELSSMEQTPAVEVVKTSELNDTEPIFLDLIDCKDSIDNIASELSSPAMKLLLVKELEGKIETVGDLAKLTELEVNRICIKAPKVQIAKKVLADYKSRKDKTLEVDNAVDTLNVEPTASVEHTVILEPTVSAEPIVNEEPEPVLTTSSVSIQTNILTSETETQTSMILQIFSSTQTDGVLSLPKSSQTIESGNKTTEDIIKSCLRDRKDFVPKLNEQLAEILPVDDCKDLLMKKMTSSDVNSVLSCVLQRESELNTNRLSGNKELACLQNFMCDRYDAMELILFCSQLMKQVYDKGV